MPVADAFFYLFSVVMLISACMVITARHPVHSVLFLILVFFNAAGLFVLAGAEFIAMVLVIVYVGAVAVLFLFVVMMLDVDFAALKEGFQSYAPLGLAVGFVLMVEIGVSVGGWEVAPAAAKMRLAAMPAHGTDAAAIGDLLYTHYVYVFELSSILLLVGMIGAIVLTHGGPRAWKQQDIGRQHSRSIDETLTMVKIQVGSGAERAERRPHDAVRVSREGGSDERNEEEVR